MQEEPLNFIKSDASSRKAEQDSGIELLDYDHRMVKSMTINSNFI